MIWYLGTAGACGWPSRFREMVIRDKRRTYRASEPMLATPGFTRHMGGADHLTTLPGIVTGTQSVPVNDGYGTLLDTMALENAR